VKSCPHCEFLVADDATACSVCHQPVAVPAQPAGPWGSEPAPAPAGWAPVASGAPAAAGPGGATWVPPAPVPAGSRRGGVVALGVIGGLVALVLVLLVGVTFIGTTAKSANAAPPSDWKVHRDPAGRYQVELPGAPATRTKQEDAGLSAPIETVTAEVTRRSWDSFVLLIDLPQDPGGIDLSLDAMRERILDGVRNEPSVTRMDVQDPQQVTAPSGPALDVRFTATVDGVAQVGRLRVLHVGADSYALATLGPAAQESEVQKMQDRITGSFAAPAPA
jgi:hypothetical protein